MELRRSELRSKMTAAEVALWTLIKNRQLDGRKFRRQFSVGSYVLDFYCVSEQLCVELDGYDHFTPEGIENDLEREKFLEQQGIKVIRIENKKVFDNTQQVLEYIRDNFKNSSEISPKE